MRDGCQNLVMTENHAARLLTVIQTLRGYSKGRERTLAEIWALALHEDDSPLQLMSEHVPPVAYAFWQSHYSGSSSGLDKSKTEESIYPSVAEYSKLVWVARAQASRMVDAGIDLQRSFGSYPPNMRWTDSKTWSHSFFPADHGFHSKIIDSGDLISPKDLRLLRGVAESWRQIEPLISVVPTINDRRKLRDEVNDLIVAMLEDEALDVLLRDAIVQSLHDVLWAVDHWIATGSDGVKAACERLGFRLTTEKDGKYPGFKGVWVTLKRIWTFASILSDVGGAHQTLMGIGENLMLDR